MTPFPAERVVEAVTDKIYEKEPDLLLRFGERGKMKCREDNHHHLHHLQTAYELDNPKIFSDYAVWLDGILLKHGMQTQHLVDNFTLIEEVLKELELEDSRLISSYLSYLHAGKKVLQTK